jgi:hypothetical protein
VHSQQASNHTASPPGQALLHGAAPFPQPGRHLQHLLCPTHNIRTGRPLLLLLLLLLQGRGQPA